MYDVIVVGAGISGLRCAELLSSEGLSVLVIEKNIGTGGSFGENLEGFPEYHYSKLVLDLPASPSKELALVFGDGDRKTWSRFRFENPVIRIVKRGSSKDSLDSNLLERSLRAGTTVSFNEKFSDLNNTKTGGIEVKTTSGARYESKVLVAADGVFSSVKKLASSSKLLGRTEGVGYIAKMKGVVVKSSEIIGIFNYRLAPGAYCYVIGYPEGDFATVGLTLRPPYTTNAVGEYFHYFVSYVPEILGAAQMVEETRGFVTLGSRDRKLLWNRSDNAGFNNVIFVGEAGGFQDPTLAFGLYPALHSATLASHFIVRAIKAHNLRILDGYQKVAREELIQDERRKLRFRYLLESLSGQEIESLIRALSKQPEKVERMLTTGNYVSNVATTFLKTLIKNPSLLAIPVKYLQTQRAVHSRDQS
ncbi:MAG: NAD(P)/FAD-dependent oxidoreductase [Thaumarchaeota archaeon]|nr:NAD(P)/FAD-dependent oxidoreductase [Nitrososphaerota archaeon]